MSSFQSECPHCGQLLELQEEWCNMKVNCPSCNETFVVPDKRQKAPESMFRIKVQETKTYPTFGRQEPTPKKESFSYVPSKKSVTTLILIIVGIIVFRTRFFWNNIYDNVSIAVAVISAMITLIALVKAINIVRKNKIATGTGYLSILSILFASITLIVILSVIVRQDIPNENYIVSNIREKKSNDNFILSGVDKKENIEKVQIQRESFLNFSGTISLNRNGKVLERPIKVSCKYYKGVVNYLCTSNVDYSKNETFLQEDTPMLLNVVFIDSKYPELKDVKTVAVRADKKREGVLIYTIEQKGVKSEVETDFTKSFEKGERDGDGRLKLSVISWKNDKWHYERGMAFLKGINVPKDPEKAFYHLNEAAKMSNKVAVQQVAQCYVKGIGTERNPAKAFEFLKEMADQGNEDAMLELQKYYFSGTGTPLNLENGLKILQKLAEKGNIEAKIRIAVYYAFGKVSDREDEDENRKKAFYMMKQLADEDHPSALRYLALFYNIPIGISEQEPVQSYQLMKKAADKGDEDALVLLNSYLWKGTGVERNRTEAREKLRDLAEIKNIPAAQHQYANLLLTGDVMDGIYGIFDWDRIVEKIESDTKKDRSEIENLLVSDSESELRRWFNDVYSGPKEKSDDYFRKIQGVGSRLRSQRERAGRQRKTKNTSNNDYNDKDVEFIFRELFWKRYWTKNVDGQRIISLLKKTVDSGSSKASVDLGTCYALGFCVDRNRDLARSCFQNAIAIDSSCIKDIVKILEIPYVREKIGKDAMFRKEYWWKKGVEIGDPDSMIELAKLAMKENDMERAKDLLEDAVRINPAEAVIIAQEYMKDENDFSGEKDLTKAFYWMEKAAAKKVVVGQLKLSRMYREQQSPPNYEKAFYWAKAAAESENDVAQWYLGTFYVNGWGCERDLEAAKALFEKSAKQNNARALFDYVYYSVFQGDNNDLYRKAALTQRILPEDFRQKAFEMMKQSAELGYYPAQLTLNKYYEKNYDSQNAFLWISEAAKQGQTDDGYAMLILARYYQDGYGVEQDSGRAFHWISKSAERGYPEALVRLANFYWNGEEGLSVDKSRARKLMKQAADKGNITAKEWLASH